MTKNQRLSCLTTSRFAVVALGVVLIALAQFTANANWGNGYYSSLVMPSEARVGSMAEAVVDLDAINTSNSFALSVQSRRTVVANFSSAQSGAWDNPATWGSASFPVAGDNVTINNLHMVTVTGNQGASTLTVNGGGTLSINAASTLAITSSFLGEGGSTVSGAGTFRTDGSVSMTVKGDFGAIFSAALRVNSGITTSNFWGNGVSFSPTEFAGPIVIAGGAILDSAWTEAQGTVTVDGTVENSPSGGNRFDFNGASLTNNGTVSVNDFRFGRNGTQNVSGAGLWSGGQLSIGSGSIVTPTSAVKFGYSDFVVGFLDTIGTLALNGQTVIIDRPAATVNVTVERNGTVSGAGTFRTDGTVSITVKGDFGAVFSSTLRVNSGITTGNAWGNGVGFSPTEFGGPQTIVTGATLAANWVEASGPITNNGTIGGAVSNRFDFNGSSFINDGTVSINDFRFGRNGVQSVSGAGTWTGGGVSILTGSMTTLDSSVVFAPTGGVNVNGTLDQGVASDLTVGPITIAVGGVLMNLGTGGLNLSGNLTNNGSVQFNGNGVGCGQIPKILIRSTIIGTQRNWSGGGTFSLTDSDVKDQAGSSNIPVFGGVNSGNNGANWSFSSCPTAAGVEVSGRVLTMTGGRGLLNARVTLTDQNGQTRTTTTGRFGYYRFVDVEVGQTYVVSVRSRRYTFTPRVLTVFDNLLDVDLFPEQ